MPVIGITGGIASGKSTVTRMIKSGLLDSGLDEVESFSADDYSHELMDHDPEVRGEIVQAFGSEVIGEDGSIQRALLREIIFKNPSGRKVLENILHPKIHSAWRTRSESFRGRRQYLVAEIPLLYETNSASYFDCIAVVAADAETQLQRLSSKRGWSLETARRVIEAQMPAEEKILRANILILNHHTEKLLEHQINLAVGALLTQYA